MIQAHIFYSGMVQGVGFRYTVARFANELDLTGWVRNLSDGRVEALVEGPKAQIEKLCSSVEGHFSTNVTDKTIDFKETEGRFKAFEITA